MPTVCAETCVGRLRYIGLMLYDADEVLEAASTEDDQGLCEAQRDVFLDPFDPEVMREAEKAGIARDWIDSAQNSPIYALINTYKVTLPLHPNIAPCPWSGTSRRYHRSSTGSKTRGRTQRRSRGVESSRLLCLCQRVDPLPLGAVQGNRGGGKQAVVLLVDMSAQSTDELGRRPQVAPRDVLEQGV